MNGIEIRQVFKRYGAVQALSNVNICFGEQKIYGLLGRNGAGKSTLLNVATNRIFADGGAVSYTHLDVYKRQMSIWIRRLC